MPKVFQNDIVYDYSPLHTILHLHRKYPNPFATHVFSVDTISRTIDPETGILRSERLLGVQQGAPRWITRLFQLPPVAYVREVVFVNPADEDGNGLSAVAFSVNLSLSQYVSCLEHIIYSVYPPTASALSAQKTLFSQRARITSGFPTGLVARRIEQASIDRFKANAGVGKKGFEWVLNGGQVTGRGFKK